MFFILLLSYGDTRESLGELQNDVETLACNLCSHSFFEFSQVKSRLNGVLLFTSCENTKSHMKQ